MLQNALLFAAVRGPFHRRAVPLGALIPITTTLACGAASSEPTRSQLQPTEGVVEDAGLTEPNPPGTNHGSPGDVDSEPNASPDGGAQVTASIHYVVDACVGEALPEECAPEEKADGEDDGGCSETPRPCSAWDEDQCEYSPGCHWGQREIVNEGTDTGKSCTGTPVACGKLYPTFCNAGCEETTSSNDEEATCVGTPAPCATFLYSEDCATQLGCRWQ